MTTVKQVTSYLESIAPKQLQESYDNAGLITGSPGLEVTGVVISLDCTEDVIDEAIARNANMVVAHHPIVFKGLKSLTGSNYVERTIIKAIKNDIAIYAIHTNLDNIMDGVNRKFADQIGLTNQRVLKPIKNLQKLVTFIPEADTEKVLDAIHKSGAGNIGNYSECSFKVTGKGYFKPNEEANPAIGESNHKEEVDENRVEVIFPDYLGSAILAVLKEAHPYEEVAYYLTSLENLNQDTGAGMIGDLEKEMSTTDFLEHLKNTFNLDCIKHTSFSGSIKKVAVCGGSGSFLINDAKRNGADAFVTGDVKYHEFFDADSKLIFCDIGHYESEVGTKDLLYDLLTKKFTTFALHLSECNTNPIRYYK
ncbi:MAG: Nif3-like dinuclear metal center hexameric protein [Bacteroidota bacterium]